MTNSGLSCRQNSSVLSLQETKQRAHLLGRHTLWSWARLEVCRRLKHAADVICRPAGLGYQDIPQGHKQALHLFLHVRAFSVRNFHGMCGQLFVRSQISPSY